MINAARLDARLGQATVTAQLGRLFGLWHLFQYTSRRGESVLLTKPWPSLLR